MAQPARPRVHPLAVIRISIITMVVILAAIAWWKNATRHASPASVPDANLITLVIWSLATAALILFRRQLAAAKTAAKRANITIMGWTAGEIAAVAGIVYFVLSGNPQRFVFGMLVFVLAMIAFPIPRDR